MTTLSSPLAIEDTIRSLLADVMQRRIDTATLAVTDDLYGAGLSSLATVDLMLAVEDRFGVEFTSQWLNRRTFGSIAAIGNAVRRLQEDAP